MSIWMAILLVLLGAAVGGICILALIRVAMREAIGRGLGW